MSDDLARRGVIRADLRDPFGLPRGVLGRLAGRVMARGNAVQQREVIEMVELESGARVLEIGYGPGELATLVLARDPTIRYAGVDPSDMMQAQAVRRNAVASSQGRADFLIGAAAEVPFPNGAFDVVVAVNNVRVWPDLGQAAREIRRVLASGGSAVVTWHGRQSRSWIQRRLAMTDEEWSGVEDAFRVVFDSVARRELPSSMALVAVDRAAPVL
jgi:ubiquinone/menaquinone biosynthesis C-methylase UbiE